MRLGGYDIRGFVVTLQETPEREKFIMDHFKSVGIEAETFGGIHGQTAGLRTIFPYERDAPGSGWNIGTGPVGTWMSFWALYSACNILPDQHFMLMEYDCKFLDGWKPKLEQALADVPKDFDMLYVGSCCTADAPKDHVKGNVWDVRWPMCGHCIIVAKKAIPVILRTNRKCFSPWDISLLLNSFQYLKVYCILPRLTEQFGTDLKV